MASTSDVSEGPVLTVLTKRIRNLRKKLNRITQIEQSNQIKNKEQQDLLLSKPSLLAVIDELEKLRLPLTNAVDEELKTHYDDVTKKLASGHDVAKPHLGSGEKTFSDKTHLLKTGSDDVTERNVSDDVSRGDDVVEDLLKVIYFGSVFNVKMGRSEFDNVMLTRTHERNCCLTYDTVTDDDVAIILNEGDLDLLSEMSELLVSRPVDSSFSHEVALRRCVEHARKWVAGSQERIGENSNVTYAALREKLAKIIGSYYYKITPEMKAPADVAAEAAAESYVFVQAESEVEQKEDNATDFQRNETYDGQSSPVDDYPKGETEAENSLETPVQMDSVEAQAAGGTDNKDQYVPRRTHQNQRGGGRNGGGRGNGRGYGNGRGGRSGGRGGPYQNGRNQYNDQQGNYHPRNHHGGRGRGGRGNGGGYAGGYNNHASGGAEVAQS